jgi:hypothetical protein
MNVGERKGGRRYNSQPILALSRFVGIADGLLTPVDKKWHTLKPRNPELLEDKAVKDWFYNVNQLLFDYRYNISSRDKCNTRSTLSTIPWWF